MRRPLVTLGVLLLLSAAVLIGQTTATKPQAKGTKRPATPQLAAVQDPCHVPGVLEIRRDSSGALWVKIVAPAHCYVGQKIKFKVWNTLTEEHKIDISACTMLGGNADAGCAFTPAKMGKNEKKTIEDKNNGTAAEGKYRCEIKVDGAKVKHSQNEKNERNETDPDIEITKPPGTGRGAGNPQK